MALNGNGNGRGDRLKSWKEIAAYFGTNERTVKRWEGMRGLPVRRFPGGARATVYANVPELEAWMRDASPKAHVSPATDRPGRVWRVGGSLALAVLVLAATAATITFSAHGSDSAAVARHTPSQKALDLYLAGTFNFEQRTPDSLRRAVTLFRQAIAEDPAYAAPHAGLANCYLLLREYAGMPEAQAYPLALAAAERALKLDDRLAEAHAARAFVAFYWTRDWARGLAGFERAIALDPTLARAHHWRATALYHAGRITEALAAIGEAQRLDPESRSILADKGLILFHAGRVQEATALLRQLAASDPEFLSPHAYLAQIALAEQDLPNYLVEARTAARLRGDADQLALLDRAGLGLAGDGERGMLRAMLTEQLRRRAAGQGSDYAVAASYAMLGERDAALRHLEASDRAREGAIISVRVDPALRSLRAIPEFRRLAARIGGPA